MNRASIWLGLGLTVVSIWFTLGGCNKKVTTSPVSLDLGATDSPTPMGTTGMTHTPTGTATFTASFSTTFTPTLTMSSSPSPGTPTPTWSPTSTASPTAVVATATSTPTATATATCYHYFGSSGGTSQSAFPDTLSASRYTASMSGTMMYITCNVAQPGQLIVGLYTDDGGTPGVLVAQSASQSVTTGWNPIPGFSGLALSAGTYWLAFETNGGAALLFDGGPSGEEYQATVAYGTLPSTFPAGTASNNYWAIYAGYTICGAPTAIPSATSTATAVYTSTPTTTPHTTPILTPPSQGIFWNPCEIGGVVSPSTDAAGYFVLSVNGAAETTAGVTLTTPNGDIPFTCVYPGTTASTYYPATGFTIPYVAGGTYTMTTTTSIGVASATLTAPGDSVTLSADGFTASWGPVEGNEDYIEIRYQSTRPSYYTFQSYLITTDLQSPYQIPTSAYPLAGNYSVQIVPQNTTYDIAGAASGSRFTIKKYCPSYFPTMP